MPITAIRWRASHSRDVPLSESLTGSWSRSDERVNSAVHQQAQRIEATNGISTAGPRERVNDGAAQQFDELSCRFGSDRPHHLCQRGRFQLFLVKNEVHNTEIDLCLTIGHTDIQT